MVKIKGTAVSDTLQQIKEKRGIDGYNRVVSSLNEESRAILVDQTIFPSSFYSLDAFVDLLQQIVLYITVGITPC